jgi:hypothetical protein
VIKEPVKTTVFPLKGEAVAAEASVEGAATVVGAATSGVAATVEVAFSLVVFFAGDGFLVVGFFVAAIMFLWVAAIIRHAPDNPNTSRRFWIETSFCVRSRADTSEGANEVERVQRLIGDDGAGFARGLSDWGRMVLIGVSFVYHAVADGLVVGCALSQEELLSAVDVGVSSRRW